MSFKVVKAVLGAVVVAGIGLLGVAGHRGWIGDPEPGATGARLLAEGTIEREKWALVLVRTADGETARLRSRGVDVKVAELGTEDVLDRPRGRFVPGRYEMGLVTLPGTGQPMFFGLLPDGAARAEVVPDINIKIQTSGGTTGAYVFQSAPGSPATWQGKASVPVDVFDAQGRPLLQAKPK